MRIEKRDLVLWIILSIVTCGICHFVWMAMINDDTSKLTMRNERLSGGIVVLLSIITCGIYAIYWHYSNAKLVAEYISSQQGGYVSEDLSLPALLLSLFGLGIVSLALQQNQLNKLAQ